MRFAPCVAIAVSLTAIGVSSTRCQVDTRWSQHSMDRPRPPVVDPGPERAPVPPPADAIVLFDHGSLSAWRQHDGSPARWAVDGDSFAVEPGTGNIVTARAFGDCQLHVEWAAPTPPNGLGQERGNSGVFLMGLYEVQVLDSYHNDTYPDGQAAAVYGQFPPLVNASRPPGRWQSYDIIFHRPRFDASGAVTSPARLTVFHNGVLVQDNVALSGPTANKERPPYHVTPDSLPLELQDHHNRVRYRDIWIRPID